MNEVLDTSAVSASFIHSVERDFAREHLVLSQGQRDGRELLAVSVETDPFVIHNIGVLLGVCIDTKVVDGEILARAIDSVYGALERPEDSAPDLEGPILEGIVDLDLLEQIDRDLLSTQGKGPVVKFVDGILFESLGKGASDIHIQPLDAQTLIRYRIDGSLYTIREVPKKLTQAIVSRVKVMGRMDIAEKRIPQDGRASVSIGSRPIDLRISTFPTSYGERAVLRLLDNSQRSCDFESLGMPHHVAEPFLESARRSNGIVLVTGPTGSGKTTTLYGTLRNIASSTLNVMTIEDPIEYELSTLGISISQAQVNTKKGVTFATGLRHILRQDPDVVLVGEIRDIETARMAIQSSLTGHLVFSTLHTNDAPSAVTRLIDLGVEPYLVASSLTAVLAQRLVRIIHDECRGEGCDKCLHTGLQGRTGVFEFLKIDEEMRGLITRGTSASDLRILALSKGMKTLFDDGERLVREGKTTRSEIARVTQEVS